MDQFFSSKPHTPYRVARCKTTMSSSESPIGVSFIDALREVCPLSFNKQFLRQLLENQKVEKVSAIIPFNLGKIQTTYTQVKEIWKILNNENHPDSLKESTKRSITLEKTAAFQRPLSSLQSLSKDMTAVKNSSFRSKNLSQDQQQFESILMSHRVSNSTETNTVVARPRSAIHYMSKNRSKYAPGVIRIIPKHSRNNSIATDANHFTIQAKTHRSLSSTERNSRQSQKNSCIISPSLHVSEQFPIIKKSTEKSELYEETYSGEYSNGKRQGHGKVIYPNGDIYVGDWYENKKQGHGAYTYSNSQIEYEGSWYNDNKHGIGIMKSSTGQIEGRWENNILKESNVIFTYDELNIYKGESKSGTRDGNGSMKYQSGAEYVGLWCDDRREKHGCIRYKQDFFFEGHFYMDSTHGYGVLIRSDIIKPPKRNPGYSKSMEGYQKPNINNQDYHETLPEFAKLHLKYTDIVYITYTADIHRRFPSGTWKSGKLNGSGLAYYGIYGYYEGNFTDGQRDGWGKMIYNDNTHVCAWFPETEGEYIGHWRNDARHGQGIMTWPNGAKYEGKFNMDRRHHVMGKMTFETGEVYDGGWVNDKLQGYGKLILASGIVFKARFNSGIAESSGTVEFADKVYEGAVMNFVPNGKGKMRYKNGDIFDGDFEDGVINGIGKMTYANGNMYEGEWVNGCKDGNGTMIYRDEGTVYNGEWLEDKRSGKGELKDMRGKVIYHGDWVYDLQDGIGEMVS